MSFCRERAMPQVSKFLKALLNHLNRL
uniref:Uncharacterized protein n=1 Tax=Arundo donax TaxID=35708 RepID=A0A0A9FLA9_ARUDO